MFYDEKLLEFVEKINGIALRKAEVSKDIEGVYSKILENLPTIQDFEDISALEILGELGG
ncbi:MAG: hypothetical protein QXI09_01430 [Candidatus Aenigmatarchaeota archaeon]